MDEIPFPSVPKALLDDLDTRFPDRCPPLGMSEAEIYYRSGQRAVVAFLQDQFNLQNEIFTEEEN